jgi:hypothetical protein
MSQYKTQPSQGVRVYQLSAQGSSYCKYGTRTWATVVCLDYLCNLLLCYCVLVLPVDQKKISTLESWYYSSTGSSSTTDRAVHRNREGSECVSTIPALLCSTGVLSISANFTVYHEYATVGTAVLKAYSTRLCPRQT